MFAQVSAVSFLISGFYSNSSKRTYVVSFFIGEIPACFDRTECVLEFDQCDLPIGLCPAKNEQVIEAFKITCGMVCDVDGDCAAGRICTCDGPCGRSCVNLGQFV